MERRGFLVALHPWARWLCRPGVSGIRLGSERSTTEFWVRDGDKRRALDYYDGVSTHYNDRVARGPLKLFREREHDAILGFARFEDPTKKTALDVGCGGGFYALAARRAGLHASGVDIAAGMIEKLKERIDAAWVGDVESLAAISTYDIIICAGVLDFVLDPELAFKNLARLLAPGGRLVVLVPRSGLAGWVYRLEKKLLKIEVNLFSLAWFEAAAKEWGLHVAGYKHPLPTNLVVLFERPPLVTSFGRPPSYQ